MKSIKAKIFLLIGAILSIVAIIFKENIENVIFYMFITFAIIILITACIMEKVNRDK